jgi:exosortase H (IPTLxxWG-CTERM-specific)
VSRKKKVPDTPPVAVAPPLGMSRGMIIRYCCVFPALVLAGFELLLAPRSQNMMRAFAGVIVKAAGMLIHLFRGQAIASGDILMSPLNGFQIQVVSGCNAVNVTILLWAAMLVYPASWTQRLKGVVLGSFAIHGLNLLRVISLFYLGQYNAALFDFAHFYLWEGLIVVDTLVAFGVWAHLIARSPDPHAA